jgi:hypothetical protein
MRRHSPLTLPGSNHNDHTETMSRYFFCLPSVPEETNRKVDHDYDYEGLNHQTKGHSGAS